jgi:uncharacterized protein
MGFKTNMTITSEMKAAAFDRLSAHLRGRTDVQNLDLMNLAGFCRNCLSQWLSDASADSAAPIDKETARTYVYGMPYSEWKTRYQR